MSAIKRTRDDVDALEHAMQGVHTSEDHEIVGFSQSSGVIGTRSRVDVRDLDDTVSEREVIVRMSPSSRRHRR
jgi:hypothetical protein